MRVSYLSFMRATYDGSDAATHLGSGNEPCRSMKIATRVDSSTTLFVSHMAVVVAVAVAVAVVVEWKDEG